METMNRTLLTFLLNALWQAPLAWAVAALACRLMRNGPARHRHAVWVAALFAAFLLPALSTRAPERAAVQTVPANSIEASPLASADSPGAKAGTQADTQGQTGSRTQVSSISFTHDWAMLLLGAYGMWIVYRAGRLLRALYRTWEIRRDATPGTLANLLGRCETAFSTRGIALLRSEDIAGPVALHRAIVLPDAMFAESREDVLATAVGHEMAHIARHDFMLKLLYELLYVPLCFHPAAIFIHREIENSREMACDELVTRHLLEPTVYARSIMTIAGALSPLDRAEYALGVFDGDILEERIRSLMERRGGDLRRARIALAGALSAFAVCVVFASGLAVSGYAQTAVQSEMLAAADAFNHGNFKGAAEHFESAVKLDPANVKAKLFLANALVRQSLAEGQYMPVSDDKPLLINAQKEYRQVLESDPRNTTAMFGVISLNGPARAGESRDMILHLLAIDPSNKEAYYAYYTLGTLDWMIAYDATRSALEALGASPAVQQIPDAAMRTHLREHLAIYIDEGLRVLQIALAKEPDSDSAMAYINLMLRIKGLIAETAHESAAYTGEADKWVSKALDARRLKANRPKPADAIDANGEPGVVVPAPPPPPPPPPGTAPRPRNPKEGGGGNH